MANKSVFQNYDADAVDHFGLEGAPYFGVPTSSTIETVLVTESEKTYKKINEILQECTYTVNPQNFVNCKKAFLLPRSPISIDRIKAALKEHKITLTNDYEAADLIISHDDFYKSFSHGAKIQTSVMTYKLWNFESISDSQGFIASVDKYHERECNHVIWDEKLQEYYNIRNCITGDSVYDVWVITGLALNIAYKIDIGAINAVSVDDILHSSANRTPFDKELGDLIRAQVSNYNNDDLSLAGKLIPTIDYNHNLHLFWDWCCEMHSYIYKFNSNKDVQYWLEASNFSEISRMSAQDMILWLEEEDKLNSENFRYLESIVRKEISIHNRDLYVFKVSVKPEYRKYLKPSV